MRVPRSIAIVLAALALSGCGMAAAVTSSRSPVRSRGPGASRGRASEAATGPRDRSRVRQAHDPPPPAYPHVLPAAAGTGPTAFVPAVTLHGAPIAYVARTSSGVALLSFDQRYLALRLHSGSTDAGPTGWRFGDSIARGELAVAVAGFNGGFQLNTGAGGFFSYGRTAVSLQTGLGSVVSYADGYTDIGSWHREVPRTGHGAVVSVRQNLHLLIDGGKPAANVACDSCWGATLGGVAATARSAIGISADGRLMWAGGEHAHVTDIVNAFLAAHVVRAIETDINPEWVAAYPYQHHGASHAILPTPIAPRQVGSPASCCNRTRATSSRST